jgi:hypothetical protein
MGDSLAPADSARVADSTEIGEAAPERKKLRFEFYQIEDAELLAELWKLTGEPGETDDGHYQVLKILGDSGDHAFLLREGTQVGRLPDSVVPGLRTKIQTLSGMQEGRLSQSLLGNFWNPIHPLEPFLWPTGLALEGLHSGTVLKNSTPQLRQTYGGWFGVRPLPWTHVEIGAYMDRFAGGLRRNLFNPQDTGGFNVFEASHFRGYVALGIPGIKWEIALDNRNYPEYFWLDPRAGDGSYVIGREEAGTPVNAVENFQDATLIRGWKRGGRNHPKTPNYAQALRLKIGQIRYSAVYDPDMYNSIIHDLMFDELPAPFGRWGLGFVFAEGAAHTRIRIDLLPVTLGMPKPTGSTFSFFFLRLDFAIRDAESFHLGASTVILLDSPILRPGGKP